MVQSFKDHWPDPQPSSSLYFKSRFDIAWRGKHLYITYSFLLGVTLRSLRQINSGVPQCNIWISFEWLKSSNFDTSTHANFMYLPRLSYLSTTSNFFLTIFIGRTKDNWLFRVDSIMNVRDVQDCSRYQYRSTAFKFNHTVQCVFINGLLVIRMCLGDGGAA